MATIKWQEAYSVGVKELDDQHKDLLDIFNKVTSEQLEKYDEIKFSSSLSLLIRYLEQVNFPEIKQHVLEHIDFIMKTLGLALRIEEESGENRKELLRYLNEWYSLHVLGLDRHYIPFLESIKNK
jgi:hemerythrin